jgi:hypothetical protein
VAVTVRWRMWVSFKFKSTDDHEVPIPTYRLPVYDYFQRVLDLLALPRAMSARWQIQACSNHLGTTRGYKLFTYRTSVQTV